MNSRVLFGALSFVIALFLIFPVCVWAIEGSSSSYTLDSGIIGEGADSAVAASSSYTATVSSPTLGINSGSSDSFTINSNSAASAVEPAVITSSPSGTTSVFSFLSGGSTKLVFIPWGQDIAPGNRSISVRFLSAVDNSDLNRAFCRAKLNFVFSPAQEDIDSNVLYRCGSNWCANLVFSDSGVWAKMFSYPVADLVSSGSYTVTCSLSGFQSASFTDQFTVKAIVPPLSGEVLNDQNQATQPGFDQNKPIVQERIAVTPQIGRIGTVFEVVLVEGSTPLRKAYFSLVHPDGSLSQFEMQLRDDRAWRGSFTVDDSIPPGNYELKVFGVLQETVLEFETVAITIESTPFQSVVSFLPVIVALIAIGIVGVILFRLLGRK